MPAALYSLVLAAPPAVAVFVEPLLPDDPQPLASRTPRASAERRARALRRAPRHGRGEAITGESITLVGGVRRAIPRRTPSPSSNSEKSPPVRMIRRNRPQRADLPSRRQAGVHSCPC